jgi:hypothetical protein
MRAHAPPEGPRRPLPRARGPAAPPPAGPRRPAPAGLARCTLQGGRKEKEAGCRAQQCAGTLGVRPLGQRVGETRSLLCVKDEGRTIVQPRAGIDAKEAGGELAVLRLLALARHRDAKSTRESLGPYHAKRRVVRLERAGTEHGQRENNYKQTNKLTPTAAPPTESQVAVRAFGKTLTATTGTSCCNASLRPRTLLSSTHYMRMEDAPTATLGLGFGEVDLLATTTMGGHEHLAGQPDLLPRAPAPAMSPAAGDAAKASLPPQGRRATDWVRVCTSLAAGSGRTISARCPAVLQQFCKARRPSDAAWRSPRVRRVRTFHLRRCTRAVRIPTA